MYQDARLTQNVCKLEGLVLDFAIITGYSMFKLSPVNAWNSLSQQFF